MMKQQTYWNTTVARTFSASVASLPAKTDVAVIGAGYTGLGAACELARRGLRVVVLEAQTVGWGASSRNGGMVLTGLKLGMRTIWKRYGADLARALFDSSVAAIDRVEAIIREGEIDCGFSRSGHFLAASKPEHYDALEAEAEFLADEFGHQTRLVSRASQNSEVGCDAYYGGLIDDLSAGLNPAQYVAGLAILASRLGAIICERSRVLRISRTGAAFELQTPRGRLAADRVLVATAGYTGNTTPALQRRIIPIGSFIVATEQLDEDVAQGLIPNGRMVFDSLHFLHYYRLWDRRLIFGGRAAFFPETSSSIRQSAGILRADMTRLFPQLQEVRVEYAWGGTLDFAFDMMPHVGEMDGLAYALGYAGHGVAMGTYLGQTAAAAMMDGTLQDHPFNAIPFPGAPLGLYNGWPWFLPLVGLAHRLRDVLE
jgi:glycine/D-amino acid oxidase-like deaminating enzyme